MTNEEGERILQMTPLRLRVLRNPIDMFGQAIITQNADPKVRVRVEKAKLIELCLGKDAAAHFFV